MDNDNSPVPDPDPTPAEPDPGLTSRNARFDRFLEEARAEPHREGDTLWFTARRPVDNKELYDGPDPDAMRAVFTASGSIDIESVWKRKMKYITETPDGDPEIGFCAKATRGAFEIRYNNRTVLVVGDREAIGGGGGFTTLMLKSSDLGTFLRIIGEARAYAAPGRYEPRARERLWQLLDDIDTADDALRDNDAGFRECTRTTVKERHAIASSDGYKLSWAEDR